ncbi:MAG: hypothetical protein LBG12_05920 [Synergistaceae bacterium]|nr:hypothetical protein [Synergistaceae bacterium]
MEPQTREPQMGLTFEKVWAMFQESDRQMQELRESQRESQRETERLMRESQLEMERVVKETSKNIGGLNNSFGELAEHLVAPNIEEKFNALGYHFEGISPNQKIKNEKGQIIAEIDILLENDEYSVAVEVKSKPKRADIDDFEKRLEVLRKYKDKHHDIRRIRGAIAGAVFQDDVKSAVLKAGFYAIEQTGDTVKISVPKDFKPKEW